MTAMTAQRLQEAKETGMLVALFAAVAPDRQAVISPFGARSFSALNRHANQLARAFRAAGLAADSGVALLSRNRPEFVETIVANHRSGMRVTAINWHLTTKEVAYIVEDCEAEFLVADAAFAEAALAARKAIPNLRQCLAVGGDIAGFEDYHSHIAGFADDDLDDPELGRTMLYTSGTTGHPKGVYRRQTPATSVIDRLTESAQFDGRNDKTLITGPLYHAAPLALNMQFPLAHGVGIVLMDRWDAEQTLALIQEHKISHTHMVPTMFHRLLQLPEAARHNYDLKSLRWLLHGAAPCPVDIKRQMIDWLGPVLYEYYAATEGGGITIDSSTWLLKQGSVGQCDESLEVAIFDDAMQPVPAGETGTIYFKAPEIGRFEYFKSPEKTAAAYYNDYYTMGDMGYLDKERYLFLSGRSAEQIISGGVNIYPAEIDAVLLNHEAVHDVATIGVPNPEWGEEVKAVVQLVAEVDADAAMVDVLMAHCRANLAAFKCPRSIDFVSDLPRLPTGKILRREVRAPYWQDQSGNI